MWCMVAAPLITGNDIGTMNPEIRDILTHGELIAINQDPLGKQGRRIRDDGELEVWSKELSGGRKAVALFNRSSEPARIKVEWDEIGMKKKCKVRDAWERKNLGKHKGSYTGKNIPSHFAMALLVK